MIKDLVIMVIASFNHWCYEMFIHEYWIPLIKFTEKKYKEKIKIFLLLDTDISCNPRLSEVQNNIIVTNTQQNLIPGILNKTIKM